MSYDAFTLRGVRYQSHDSLSFGDYGGAGSVGRANIDALREQFPASDTAEGTFRHVHNGVYEETDYYGRPTIKGTPKLIMLFGAYASEAAYIREDCAAETLAALDDYPLLDEERHSEIELEWEDAAWESYARADLIASLSEATRDAWEAAGEPEDVALQAYRDAMEETNSYPETEHSSSYIPVDRIADEFGARLGAELARRERYGDTSHNGELALARV